MRVGGSAFLRPVDCKDKWREAQFSRATVDFEAHASGELICVVDRASGYAAGCEKCFQLSNRVPISYLNEFGDVLSDLGGSALQLYQN